MGAANRSNFDNVMPRFSSAYSNFTIRLSEIEKISTMANILERTRPLGSQASAVSALCRGGIVLLSSHIEGFISDLNEIILEKIVSTKLDKNELAAGFRYYHSKDIINEVTDTSDPERISEKIQSLFMRDLFIWNNEPTFTKALDPQAFLKGFSTPKPENMYRLFRRYGHNKVKRDIKIVLRSEFIIHESNVENIVELRNKIAHGNFAITQTPKDLINLKVSTHKFCRELDNSVCRWFGNLKCGLRCHSI